MRRLGPFDVHPLCLGGNVFGWTADEAHARAVLDRYAAAGGNFVDTADAYSSWAPGHEGGESETLIGRWLASSRHRERMVIATKVGARPGREGLRRETIRAAAEESLRRLGREHIDLYYAHRDDPETPLAETLGAFDELVGEGKVRAIGLSNYEPARLEEAMAVAEREALTRPVALQPLYNLVEREAYERALAGVARRHGLACVPYLGLARGFLTGKYREGHDTHDSPRAGRASAYATTDRGRAGLVELDEIAAAHHVAPAAVALAWLAAQPTVVTPIASARTTTQLDELLPMATLELQPEEHERLNIASGWR